MGHVAVVIVCLRMLGFGGTLRIGAGASGCYFDGVCTLRSLVSSCCGSVIENMSANCCNACCCWIRRLLSGIIGCGVLSASINKWAAWIAASTEDSFGIGKLMGKKLTVSDILLLFPPGTQFVNELVTPSRTNLLSHVHQCMCITVTHMNNICVLYNVNCR